jgi:hypothetical protein
LHRLLIVLHNMIALNFDIFQATFCGLFDDLEANVG